jgi:hypothetical protein
LDTWWTLNLIIKKKEKATTKTKTILNRFFNLDSLTFASPFAFWALLCCRLLAAGWAMYSPACRLPPATAHCSQKQRLPLLLPSGLYQGVLHPAGSQKQRLPLLLPFRLFAFALPFASLASLAFVRLRAKVVRLPFAFGVC